MGASGSRVAAGCGRPVTGAADCGAEPVARVGGAATLVVPELEAPRAAAAAPDLARATWTETADPYALVASLVTNAGALALSDHMWAAFTLRLRDALRDRELRLASEITRELRLRKDDAELAALRAVSAGADRAFVRALDLEFAGRTERAVGADLAALLRDEGHEEVSFVIVAS